MCVFGECKGEGVTDLDESEREILRAVEQTRIVRAPRQHLATFGVSRISYYLVTEPSYEGLIPGGREGVVREGKVISERPIVVTPTYMLNLEGFGEDARRYMSLAAQRYGPHSPGLLYRYRNEYSGMNIVSGEADAVGRRIAEDLDRRDEGSAAVILGVDELWDVSLLKFIYEYTAASLSLNVRELHGLLDPEPGIGLPRAAVQRIERLFREVERGLDPSMLKRELDRWGVFEQYEARFLGLFRRR